MDDEALRQVSLEDTEAKCNAQAERYKKNTAGMKGEKYAVDTAGTVGRVEDSLYSM